MDSSKPSQSMEDISLLAKNIRATFASQKTKPVEFRLEQLRKLWCGLQDNQTALVEACRADLGKSSFETLMGEIRWCQKDIDSIREDLAKWMEDEEVPGTDDLNGFSPRIKKEPLGTVLIIGPYNFPIQLSIAPLIGAIASGCTAVLKPSEDTPQTSDLVQKIVSNYLEPSCYACVLGGISETTTLLAEKWDKIFFTGSQAVGKIIAAKAAETLTPVTLELGGCNPAIVTESADPGSAARRLAFGKILNAGQVCLSHNYTLLHRSLALVFIQSLKDALLEMFPNGARASPDFGRIVNVRNCRRIANMLEKSSGQVLAGGTVLEDELLVEPTVVLVETPDDSLIKEESFGPLMPIILVDSTEEAISIANSVDDSPLAMSVFGDTKDTDQVLNRVRSGGATINDTYVHASIPAMPLGGVGYSGLGSYRGRASFDCFTHRRSMATVPASGSSPLRVIYPPYNSK